MKSILDLPVEIQTLILQYVDSPPGWMGAYNLSRTCKQFCDIFDHERQRKARAYLKYWNKWIEFWYGTNGNCWETPKYDSINNQFI